MDEATVRDESILRPRLWTVNPCWGGLMKSRGGDQLIINLFRLFFSSSFSWRRRCVFIFSFSCCSWCWCCCCCISTSQGPVENIITAIRAVGPCPLSPQSPSTLHQQLFFSFFILWFIFCLCSFPSDRVQRDDTRLLVIHAAAHPPFHILLLLLLLAVVFLFRLTIITGHQTLVKKKRKKILRVSSGSTGQSLISVGWIMDGVGDVDVLPACPCRCCTHCVLPNASGLFNILLHNWSMVLHSKQHSKKSRKEKKLKKTGSSASSSSSSSSPRERERESEKEE